MAAPAPLQTGDKVRHPFNRELGPGVVQDAAGRTITVHFPTVDETLVFAAASHPLEPLALQPGADPDKWLEDFQDGIVERLGRREPDKLDAFRNRLDALRLLEIREAKGLGTFLGGRVELFPHQLHVAERATANYPVRWLLADEVGLGKTVEACLILNHLVSQGQADRVLVVAPRSLVVQWLGELWRKFHQVFVLVDRERREDVRKEHGADFNPFDVYPQAVVALEDLAEDKSLAKLAVEAEPDLLVIDEAHRLRHRTGSAGSLEYRSIQPLTEAAENVLLLSATPLEADAHGFFRLLQLLHPSEFDSWADFQEQLEKGETLFPCTSCTTRQDVGGLPPREPHPVDLPAHGAAASRESVALQMPRENALQEQRRAESMQRALDEPTGPEDPRILWLAENAKQWDKNDEKTLVFVHERETLTFLKKELEYRTSRRIAVFHEDLSPAQRDLEVARFAEEDGPNVLIATESGGEGRNFQFAKRLVMFDLPWNPVLVEQRIGRLDRISRRGPVEIRYFRPANGFGRQIAELYERLGVFEQPMGSLERALGHVPEAIAEALQGDGAPQLDIDAIAEDTQSLQQKVTQAAYHNLHANRYQPEMRDSILRRVPKDLEPRTKRVVLEACRQFGFDMEDKAGVASWYLEFGSHATVEGLFGVPPGSRYLGTFDREEAVRRENLDFFATGHPLVEAVIMELADGDRGRVALVQLPEAGFNGLGLVAITRDGAEYGKHVWDLEGKERPEWVPAVFETRGKIVEVPGPLWQIKHWESGVQRLFASKELPGELIAVAGVRFGG